MKKNRLLLLLLAIGMTTSLAYAKKAHEMRLLYWNIQNGMWDGQTDDYQRFTDWVSRQQPDVCVWCEAQKNYKTNSGDRERETEAECLDRWKRLAKRYGHKYVYMSAHPDNFPQLLTSKYPIKMQKKITGTKDTIVAHGASWSMMKVGKRKFNIVTLHTWPQRYGYQVPVEKREASAARNEGDIFRSVEMKYICQETILQHKDCKDELWMMMGDFNAISRVDNDTYKLDANSPRFLTHDYILKHTPYKDAFKESHPDGFTTSTGGTSRIDFVYMTPALYNLVKDINIVTDSYTKPVRNPQKISNFWHPSDHRPIIVNFRLE